jgi:hypothetical protein
MDLGRMGSWGTLVSFVWTNLPGIVIGIFILVIADVIVTLLGRAKAVTQPIKQLFLEKPCDGCGTSGRMPCPACGGTGTTSHATTRTDPCKQCSGTGTVRGPCPQCAGSGQVRRAARVSTINGTSTTTWSLIPFGWHQRVMVPVRNLESDPAFFHITVNLGAPAVRTQSRAIQLGGHGSKREDFVFNVADQNGIPATFEIQGEVRPFSCETCSGTRLVPSQCPVCHGSGSVSSTDTLTENCPGCAGERSITCVRCGGTGRLPRFKSGTATPSKSQGAK